MTVVIEDLDTVHMKRGIGLLSSIGIIIGAVIGSGIFITPVIIVRECQSVGLSLVVWVVGGFLNLGMILTYLELVLMFPKAGGDYAYLKIINGSCLAFIRVFVEAVILIPTSCAIKSMVTVYYVMVGIYGECDINTTAVKLLSICVIFAVIAVNCYYIKFTTSVQNLTSVTKFSSLIVIISFGMFFIYKGNTDNFQDPFKDSTKSVGNVAVALFAGMYSYAGWKHLFELVEEVKQPERTIPRASMISITLVTIVYVFTNVAYMSALDPAEMAGSKAVAMAFAKKTMGVFSNLIPFMVASSTIGSLNCSLFGGSRIVFAAARDGLMPKSMSFISTTYLTPWVSMFSLGIMSMFYLFCSDALTMINYISFVSLCFQVLNINNVIYLRFAKPEIRRPFKVYILIPIFISIFTLSFVILDKVAISIQKLCLVVPDEMKN